MNTLVSMLTVHPLDCSWDGGLCIQANVLSDAGLANGLLVAGIVMVMFFLITRMRRRGKQPPPSRLSVRETLEKQKQTRALGGDLEQVMVEIEQMSRRVGSQLDAQAARLEALIAEADRRIAKLKSSETSASIPIRATSGGAGHDHQADHVARPAQVSVEKSLPADPLSRQVYALADRGMKAEAIAQELQEHIGKVELILALRRG